jgi:hypothetical protein
MTLQKRCDHHPVCCRITAECWKTKTRRQQFDARTLPPAVISPFVIKLATLPSFHVCSRVRWHLYYTGDCTGWAMKEANKYNWLVPANRHSAPWSFVRHSQYLPITKGDSSNVISTKHRPQHLSVTLTSHSFRRGRRHVSCILHNWDLKWRCEVMTPAPKLKLSYLWLIPQMWTCV